MNSLSDFVRRIVAIASAVWVETPQAGPAVLGPAISEGRGGIAGARLPPPP